MEFTKEELEWIKANKENIVRLLTKRRNDVLETLVVEEDENKKRGLQVWARELSQIINLVENVRKLKTGQFKKKDNFTGI